MKMDSLQLMLPKDFKIKLGLSITASIFLGVCIFFIYKANKDCVNKNAKKGSSKDDPKTKEMPEAKSMKSKLTQTPNQISSPDNNRKNEDSIETNRNFNIVSDNTGFLRSKASSKRPARGRARANSNVNPETKNTIPPIEIDSNSDLEKLPKKMSNKYKKVSDDPEKNDKKSKNMVSTVNENIEKDVPARDASNYEGLQETSSETGGYFNLNTDKYKMKNKNDKDKSFFHKVYNIFDISSKYIAYYAKEAYNYCSNIPKNVQNYANSSSSFSTAQKKIEKSSNNQVSKIISIVNAVKTIYESSKFENTENNLENIHNNSRMSNEKALDAQKDLVETPKILYIIPIKMVAYVVGSFVFCYLAFFIYNRFLL
ncbi:hypothetical protein EDEG_02841 [Edhazardia aedis USNM 41457]|uniref:Uncharacterized protein n=1 Tax=Edhazardia aedis (strain USNM 41457) TaxID=1003232 RepID=J8ZSX2_EDHAE|nr:hypothetical protein EDEG_02841 [Edhazardia aedis USNM 41457]|eukprot:EJW02763.1 hypothetical protein EDEG_02841 [Edhazardia aedis USNM 41457]